MEAAAQGDVRDESAEDEGGGRSQGSLSRPSEATGPAKV